MANKNLYKIIFVVTLVLCSSVNTLFAITCSYCHAKNISSLAMVCPECGHSLHDIKSTQLAKKESGLVIRLLYTGDNVANLPRYAKLYINKKYRGNIPLEECEVRKNGFSQSWSSGLGKDFTAYYEKKIKNVPAGILKVEVEMKFKRLYGFGRSYKRVVFPYVSFKPDKKTVISHYFNSAVTFSKYKPPKRNKIPVVSDMKVQAAKGNVALNVPLFK